MACPVQQRLLPKQNDSSHAYTKVVHNDLTSVMLRPDKNSLPIRETN